MIRNAVDIWMIPLTLDLPESLPLSDEELQRAQQLFPVPCRDFLISHYALRCILSRYLDIQPHQIEFQVDIYRKPSVSGLSKLCFNLSHTQGMALCAITHGRQIGVDVEWRHPIAEMDTIASSHFAPEEYRQFSYLPSEEKEAAFFALWTRKEAFVKAVGYGLLYPLNGFCVPLQPSTIDQRLTIIETEHGHSLDWSLFAFSPIPQYAAACVIKGDVLPPRLYQFKP